MKQELAQERELAMKQELVQERELALEQELVLTQGQEWKRWAS